MHFLVNMASVKPAGSAAMLWLPPLRGRQSARYNRSMTRYRFGRFCRPFTRRVFATMSCRLPMCRGCWKSSSTSAATAAIFFVRRAAASSFTWSASNRRGAERFRLPRQASGRPICRSISDRCRICPPALECARLLGDLFLDRWRIDPNGLHDLLQRRQGFSFHAGHPAVR